MSLDKELLCTVKARTDENVIPYVSTHNPKDPEIYQVIGDMIQILQEDNKIREILTKHKFLKSKRQPYNLKRLLTRAIYDYIPVY